MKRLFSIAKDIRTNALLACGAAALLSACGAGTVDPGVQQEQTAAAVTSAPVSSAENGVAVVTGAGGAVPEQAPAPAVAAASSRPALAARPGASIPVRGAGQPNATTQQDAGASVESPAQAVGQGTASAQDPAIQGTPAGGSIPQAPIDGSTPQAAPADASSSQAETAGSEPTAGADNPGEVAPSGAETAAGTQAPSH